MSLLKWQQLAKSKSKIGDKINYTRDVITKHKIGKQTDQETFGRLFKPVTSKLDDVIDSNLIRMLPRRKQQVKKGEVPDYGIRVEDDVEDMNLGDIFDEQPVSPESEKQIMLKPPSYEESLKDLLDGKKEIYIDPQYFPQNQDLPPEYDDDEVPDYAMDNDDITKEQLDDIGLPNYDSVDMVLSQPEMTPKKSQSYLKKILKNASLKRHQLKGYKSSVTKDYQSGYISDAERQYRNKRIDNARVVLNEYIKHYENKVKTMKGSGIKVRGKKHRGGNVVFFNDPKKLLNKLELIIGSLNAGNTSIKMRNTGVNILNILLRMTTINRSQYNKLYNQYFKV